MKERINKYWLELISGIKTMFKEFFNKQTNKKQRANMWSFSRLVLIIPILITSILSIATSSLPLLITSSLLIIVGEITDIFDGKSARKHKSTSDFGKLLDQVVDKTFSTLIILVLTLINPLSLFMLLGEGLIVASTVPYKMKYKDLPDSSTLIGKLKQFPLSAAFIVGYLAPLNIVWNTISISLIITTLTFQVATAGSYLKRNTDWINEYKKDENKNKAIKLNIEEDKSSDLQKNYDKNDNVNNKISEKKQFYIKLRDLINEIIILKDDENIYQKRTKSK